MRLNGPVLEAAATVTSDLLRFEAPADRVLSGYFRAHRRLGQGDRAMVAETVFAILRRKRWLEWRVASRSPRWLVLGAIVLLQGRSLRELEPLVTRREFERLQAIREAGAGEGEPERGVVLDLPDWVIERLAKVHDDATLDRLAQSLGRPAPLDLRVNTLLSDRDAVAAELAAAGIQASPMPYAPHGLRVQGRPALNLFAAFTEGRIEVQDEGSQLVCHLVAPRRGEMIVDYCAGAGGKTLALGAMMRSTGRIYALEVSQARLTNLGPRLARSTLSNVHPKRIEREDDHRLGRLAGKIDRVLVDAPCSGLGTLRRNPDLKWRQTPASVDELRGKQAAILDAAARLPRPGGRVVYATCSLLPEENEGIVEAFLARHPEWRLLDVVPELERQGIRIPEMPGPYLQLLPHVHGTDGFFAAILERTVSQEAAPEVVEADDPPASETRQAGGEEGA